MLNAALALALPLLAQTPAVPQAPADPFSAYMPMPEAALAIEQGGDSALSVEDLLRAYERATSVTLVMTEETRAMLRSAGLGIAELPELEPSQVPTFVQSVLRSNDFALSPASVPELGLIGVTSLRTNARNTIRSAAITIDSDATDTMRRNPAFLMTTVIELPHTDVRQLSNSLRSMITDANVSMLLPAGGSDSLVITGFGDWLAEMVVQLELIDSTAASRNAQPERDTRLLVRRLAHADALEIARVLDSLYGGPAPAQAGPQGSVPGTVLRWSADVRTNSVLVKGRSADVADIEALIERLDVKVE